MAPSRRRFLQLTATVAALRVLSRSASAAPYPQHPVRLVVPYPPGGPADIVARPLCASLTRQFGSPFVMEYKPGAGSNIGTEMVVRSAPDGLTLLAASSAQAINATLYRGLSYSFAGDLDPVAGVSREALLLLASPSFPAKTLAEFIAYAKAKPGLITMASAGNGTTGHVAGELFMMKAGVNLIHVPYRGAAPAIAALLGGQVQVMFTPVSGAIAQVRSRQLPVLAVTAAARLAALPDTPAVAEVVAGYEASYWNGVVAPKGTPPDVVGRLNAGINAALASADMVSLFATLGIVPLTGSPAEFGKLIAAETEKWGAVVKFAKITVS